MTGRGDSFLRVTGRGDSLLRMTAGGASLLRMTTRRTVDCRLLTVDFPQLGESFQVQIDEAFAGVFDSRGEGVGDFQEGFLRGTLAFRVAGTGEKFWEEGAGLGESHSGLEAFFPRLARGGDGPGGVAVAFENGDGLAFEVRLAAQARGEGEEGDEEAGEHQGGKLRVES